MRFERGQSNQGDKHGTYRSNIERQDRGTTTGCYPVIQVRAATIIKRDDTEISRNFHRRVVTPGDDFLAEPDADVMAIIQVVFTAESQAAYAAAQAAEGAE